MNKIKKFGIWLGIILILATGGLFYYFVKVYFSSPSPFEFVETPTQIETEDEILEFGWEITQVAQNLRIPWDMAFGGDDLIFVTERPGNLAVFDSEWNLLHTIAVGGVAAVGEGGLLGVELHPRFEDNNYIYLYYTYREGVNILNRVSRFEYANGTLHNEFYVVNVLPGSSNHNAGGLAFGPDGNLFILTGDASVRRLAQDMNSLAGKILRVRDDGSVPDDNPFGDSPIYSLGHRNPQGLDWHPITGELLATEHGSSAHDEINLIRAGANYGWADITRCFSDNPVFTDPILCSGTDTWAPSGGAFVGTAIRGLENSFFFAGLRGQLLERLEIVDGRVVDRERIIDGQYGRLRSVVADTMGNIYVGTSNRDGRGLLRSGDDKILKISPRVIVE